MTSFIYDVPFVNSVFHPSDFSAESRNAFAHALVIALLRKTKFTILHAGGSPKDWQFFPAVRHTLEKWRLLEKGSQQRQVFEDLSVRVKKVLVKKGDPVSAMLTYLKKHPTDLIVLATEGRDGLQRWLRPSAAERISLKTATKTLFIPNDAGGFVSLETGEISLNRILVPISFQPSPLPAIEYAARAAQLAGTKTEIRLLHVGEASQTPMVDFPEIPDVNWIIDNRPGDVVQEILAEAEKTVDLIIMSTAGHEGFLDALRGSVTQQVLRAAPCPLLAVPTT